MSLFSKNLRFLRKKGNRSQEEIAALFNKRANTIGNWENQKSEPSLGELMRLGDFFKVSAEDLLNKDLEALDIHTDRNTLSDSTAMLQKPYPFQEPVSTLAGEAGPDAFWLILRELRAVHEKVDLLVAGMETTGFGKRSDKSYH
jgi:transcriptional regulator with XRE-family HTH domain